MAWRVVRAFGRFLHLLFDLVIWLGAVAGGVALLANSWQAQGLCSSGLGQFGQAVVPGVGRSCGEVAAEFIGGWVLLGLAGLVLVVVVLRQAR